MDRGGSGYLPPFRSEFDRRYQDMFRLILCRIKMSVSLSVFSRLSESMGNARPDYRSSYRYLSTGPTRIIRSPLSLTRFQRCWLAGPGKKLDFSASPRIPVPRVSSHFTWPATYSVTPYFGPVLSRSR